MASLTAQEENKMIWTTNIQPSRTKRHLYLPVNHAAEISKCYSMIKPRCSFEVMVLERTLNRGAVCI